MLKQWRPQEVINKSVLINLVILLWKHIQAIVKQIEVHYLILLKLLWANLTNSNRKMKCCFCKQIRLIATHRSSHLQMFLKIDFLKNLAIFTGKHLCWSLFVLSSEYCKISKKFLKISKKRLFDRATLVTASELNSNVTNANLNKDKRLFLFFENNHTNETNSTTKKIWFFHT